LNKTNTARAESASTHAAPARDAHFRDLGLAPDLLRAVEDLGFETPTPVQASAIPVALAGRDVMACAMTGSGKTAAFLLPIMQRLADRQRGRTRALILSPTRELAAQTYEQLTALAKHTNLKGAAVFGGVGMGPQEQAFRRGVDIITATPGRLLDHMNHDYARLADIEILVLDEADRMLDMGFLPDIRRILLRLPQRPRQTLFFSATMPPPIVQLSRELLSSPARIDVERRQAPATGITQALYPVPSHLKVHLLVDLLNRREIGNAIVFCRTKHRANRLAEKLDRAGFATARIHGNRSQAQRTQALAGFKAGDYRVLVATDIVARGVDVEALEHVVNFDVPNVPEDYIHRVGRTARAGATGDAFTLVSPEDEGYVRAIERAIGRAVPRRRLEGFDYHAAVSGERLEIPLAERIAEIRARKADERRRAQVKAAARSTAPPAAQAGGSAGVANARDASVRDGSARDGSGSGGGSGRGRRPRRVNRRAGPPGA
jgi:ATP-dependent RNA helicase RhlE